jgi:molybdopterin/thiamine biosynthesis adenylyltransferase
LAGPKTVAIYDPNHVKIEDLGSNFYFNEDQVNKLRRTDAARSYLENLNPNVELITTDNNSIDYM